MKKEQKLRINFWVSEKEKDSIKQKTEQYQFISMSEYLRFVALNSEINIKHE